MDYVNPGEPCNDLHGSFREFLLCNTYVDVSSGLSRLFICFVTLPVVKYSDKFIFVFKYLFMLLF